MQVHNRAIEFRSNKLFFSRAEKSESFSTKYLHTPKEFPAVGKPPGIYTYIRTPNAIPNQVK